MFNQLLCIAEMRISDALNVETNATQEKSVGQWLDILRGNQDTNSVHKRSVSGLQTWEIREELQMKGELQQMQE